MDVQTCLDIQMFKVEHGISAAQMCKVVRMISGVKMWFSTDNPVNIWPVV